AETILEEVVPLDSVDPKFITNFRILPYIYVSSKKEITLKQLQRLVRLIKPTSEGRPPVRYTLESSNLLSLSRSTLIGKELCSGLGASMVRRGGIKWKEVALVWIEKLVLPGLSWRDSSCNAMCLYGTSWIDRKLVSMRLPVNSVILWLSLEEHQAAAEEFFENTGPLYRIDISYTHSALKQSTVDAMIDKFVPVDGGSFRVTEHTNFTRELHQTRLNKEQLERLIRKCEMSDKKVEIKVWPEGFTKSSKLTDFFDFDKYYSKKTVEERRITASREGAKLVLRVRRYDDALIWKWDRSDRPGSFASLVT
uniref:RNA-dependent RNA polymerase n=1 Tax=Steinernema glaseri TaxID=37863 RepID=A0A1I7YKK6_9BILA